MVRRLYRFLAMAVAGGVVLQAASIAWGAFGVMQDVDEGIEVEENFGLAWHAMSGSMLIPLLALALLIAGVIARRINGALRWAGIVFALVVLQVALAAAAFSAPVVGVLHGTNALLILLASIKAVMVVPRTQSPRESSNSDVGAAGIEPTTAGR
jgi:hypothetical protein